MAALEQFGRASTGQDGSARFRPPQWASLESGQPPGGRVIISGRPFQVRTPKRSEVPTTIQYWRQVEFVVVVVVAASRWCNVNREQPKRVGVPLRPDL